MEGRGYEVEDPIVVNDADKGQYDPQSSNHQVDVSGGKYQGIHAQGKPKERTMPGVELPGTAPTIGDKRKVAQSGPSAEGKAKRMRKPGPTILNARKAELGKQFENIFDWASRKHVSSEYTAEQYKRDETQLKEAVSLFGSKIEPEGQEQHCQNQLFKVEGMKNTIRDYQVVGAGFMLRQERSRNDCRGAIIADDMGIGKTIQSIACMLANQPSKKAREEHRSATLIVVPNQGVLKQWSEELKEWGGVDMGREICRYTGGGKMGAVGLQGYPYVIATYSQVERDYKLYKSEKEGSIGPLFEVEFYRIILDEGDNIKNCYGNTSIACRDLRAKLRSVLTGTPLRNGVQECIPYFRFFGIKVNEEASEFDAKWGKPRSNSRNDRAMQLLAHRMLRREVGQLFMGREVCQLPKSHFEDRQLSITNEEEIISKHLEQALLRREKDVDKDEDAPKSNFRVRCTRLRQAVEHPFLLETAMKDVLKRKELEDVIAELMEEKHSKSGEAKCEIPYATESLGSQQQESSIYSMAHYLIHHLDTIIASQDNDGCLECYGVVELQLFECGHAMCRDCYEKHLNDEITQGKPQCNCPRCGKIAAQIVRSGGELNANRRFPGRPGPIKLKTEVFKTQDGRSISIVPAGEPKNLSPGDDYNGIQPKMSNSSCRWLGRCDKLGQVPPSTKTNAAIETVGKWQKEAPNDKIVIFTEWITTANVLGRMLHRANINFVYYNGQIPIKERERSLKCFEENPDIKVLVAGIKAGSVGLNITIANRVIIMTPWWNYAAETQAFGRVKRHGQEKETYVVRLFAKNTIDERIYWMQKRKDAEIREAIKTGRKPKPLSRNENLWLMGDRNALESPFDESDEDTLGEDSDSDY